MCLPFLLQAFLFTFCCHVCNRHRDGNKQWPSSPSHEHRGSGMGCDPSLTIWVGGGQMGVCSSRPQHRASWTLVGIPSSPSHLVIRPHQGSQPGKSEQND